LLLFSVHSPVLLKTVGYELREQHEAVGARQHEDCLKVIACF
jgi:hypothetical protein